MLTNSVKMSMSFFSENEEHQCFFENSNKLLIKSIDNKKGNYYYTNDEKDLTFYDFVLRKAARQVFDLWKKEHCEKIDFFKVILSKSSKDNLVREEEIFFIDGESFAIRQKENHFGRGIKVKDAIAAPPFVG